MAAAARDLAEAAPDEDALTLQVPYDGTVRSLKALLDRLDGQAIPAGGLSVHTPDLDDVFFSLTGQPRPGQPGTAPARTEQETRP
jgi:ABC-2 type transport system ATP-binding protein